MILELFPNGRIKRIKEKKKSRKRVKIIKEIKRNVLEQNERNRKKGNEGKTKGNNKRGKIKWQRAEGDTIESKLREAYGQQRGRKEKSGGRGRMIGADDAMQR